MPTNEITANMRAEFDARYHSLRTISASGSYSWAEPCSRSTSTWSKTCVHPAAGRASTTRTSWIRPSTPQTTVHTAEQPRRRDLLVQLRHPPQEYSAAASVGVLQRAVLRASRSSIRPYNFGSSSAVADPSTTASSCRSPSPASGISRRSTARSAACRGNTRPMPATILVTGAAGFAGSHLLDLLAGEDAPIVAWHRPGGAPPRGGDRRAVGGRRSARSRRGAATRSPRLRPPAGHHCAARARRARRGTSTESTFADQRARHPSPDAMRSGVETARACPRCRARRWSIAASTDAHDGRDAAAAVEPVRR